MAKRILLSKIVKGRKIEEIIESSELYAVLYKGKPFNYKTSLPLSNAAPKYKKTVFPNPAHAVRLAERLNDDFDTLDFTVRGLHTGVDIFDASDS